MNIYSAPLQGYTEAIWRNAHHKAFGGVDVYYTPFVRIERGAFRNKDVRDVDPLLNNVPCLVPQVIASPIEEFDRVVTLFIEKGYKEIDINMGCPFPLITRKHKGSGILPYPQEVNDLMNCLSKYSDVRFSVKMRLGFEENNEWKNLIEIINDAPLNKLIIHPRIAKQQYKGSIDMASFQEIYDSSKHPVVYNGDIVSLDDINKIEKSFPNLDGIMLGRGLLMNPALAIEYKSGTKLDENIKLKQLKIMHDDIFNNSLGIYQENQVLGKMKAFWEYMLSNMDKKKSKAIIKSGSIKKYNFAVNDYFENL